MEIWTVLLNQDLLYTIIDDHLLHMRHTPTRPSSHWPAVFLPITPPFNPPPASHIPDTTTLTRTTRPSSSLDKRPTVHTHPLHTRHPIPRPIQITPDPISHPELYSAQIVHEAWDVPVTDPRSLYSKVPTTTTTICILRIGLGDWLRITRRHNRVKRI